MSGARRKRCLSARSVASGAQRTWRRRRGAQRVSRSICLGRWALHPVNALVSVVCASRGCSAPLFTAFCTCCQPQALCLPATAWHCYDACAVSRHNLCILSVCSCPPSACIGQGPKGMHAGVVRCAACKWHARPAGFLLTRCHLCRAASRRAGAPLPHRTTLQRRPPLGCTARQVRPMHVTESTGAALSLDVGALMHMCAMYCCIWR